MLEVMSRWLVQQPGHIALVAARNHAVWALCRARELDS